MTSAGPFQPRLNSDPVELFKLLSFQQVASDCNMPFFPFWQMPDPKTRKESVDQLHHVCELNCFAGARSCNILHDKQSHQVIFEYGFYTTEKHTYLTFWISFLEDNLLDRPSRHFKAGNFM